MAGGEANGKGTDSMAVTQGARGVVVGAVSAAAKAGTGIKPGTGSRAEGLVDMVVASREVRTAEEFRGDLAIV